MICSNVFRVARRWGELLFLGLSFVEVLGCIIFFFFWFSIITSNCRKKMSLELLGNMLKFDKAILYGIVFWLLLVIQANL